MINHTLPIAITPGEPAGIGPDLLVQLATTMPLAGFVVVASPELLLQRAEKLGLPLQIQPYQAERSIPRCAEKNLLTVSPVNCPAAVTPGKLNSANAGYVLETIKIAALGCMQDRFSALVTAPVHKGIINDAGYNFTGHTEYLAQLTGARLPVMMLATERLRVALATTHMPLAAVSNAITRKSLTEVIEILHHDLQVKFNIKQPRILVCGLNPHAGEGGHLGNEEIEIIGPVLESCREKGMQLLGPLPADTLFTPRYLKNSDAVLAMYHDQGLPVLKYAGFGNAVNITLGLPIIRTSVDHGTALDLAGAGKAGTGSLQAALNLATELTKP